MSLNKTLADIAENNVLSAWSAVLGRHPEQLNHIHESDAELLPLTFASGTQTLAATIDTISEEIEYGLYRNPETIGWVAAMASLSDLAAVGATPLGILVSATLSTAEGLQRGMAMGLEAACRRSQTYVLGGDTNFADKTSVSVCALGLVDASVKMTRKGAAAGDLVYATGLFGEGAALAAKVIYQLPDALYNETTYRPVARLKESRVIAPYVSACMDSSDGLLATLDQLGRINGLGIEISVPLEALLAPAALRISHTLSLPAFPFIASQHGEFELVFTVAEDRQEAFLAHAQACGLVPHKLGRVRAKPGIYIGSQEIDSARIRNLLTEVRGDLQRYLNELLKFSFPM
jgi:thiamine-monophosphate kinase